MKMEKEFLAYSHPLLFPQLSYSCSSSQDLLCPSSYFTAFCPLNLHQDMMVKMLMQGVEDYVMGTTLH